MRRHNAAFPLFGPRSGPRTILVGIDFGESSLAAARWAADHFARDAELVLVHVIPVPSGPPFLLRHLRAPGALFDRVAPALFGGLRGLAGVLGASRTRVDLRAGDPVDALATAAAAVGADAICVGRPRERSETARLGRNVVDRLLRRVRVPVLQPGGMLRAPSRILAAADGGEESGAVLAAAWSHAARLEAHVTGVHVLDEDVARYALASTEADGAAGGALASGAAGIEGALEDLTRDWMRSALHGAGARPERSDACVRRGDPGGEILAAARAHDADLIVVGRVGRDAGDGMAVGSTTRLLLRAAPCPVLVLPGAAVDAPAGPGDGGPHSLRRARRGGTTWASPVVGRAARIEPTGPADGEEPPPAARAEPA